MGVIDKLFNKGGETISHPIEAIGNVLDKVLTSKEEKLSYAEIMERLAQRPAEVQAEINKMEAQHRSVFVAGWRPFIGWVCGSALAYNYIFRDIIAWVLINVNVDATMPPALQMEHLMTILMGILGLGAYRMYEKVKGVSK